MTLGIDIGGTTITLGLVRGTEVVQKSSVPSFPQDATVEETMDYLARQVEQIFVPAVEKIGIGVPSIVDPVRGIVYDAMNIPSWKEVHLKEKLEDRYHIPASVDNDCNCFALGVTSFGRGTGYREAFCVTLGTGVGGSLVIDGHLYRGRNAGAGEIGSIPYLDKDYEYYCSSRFFIGKGTTGKEAAVAAAGGDPEALKIMEEFGGHVGKLVQMIMYAYDPAVIILGGSISKAYSLFSEPMWKEIRNFPYPKSVENLEIFQSEQVHAAFLGAAHLCGPIK